MSVPSFVDNGTFNIRDLDSNVLVAKVYVDTAATDFAGGRGYVIHWALVKSSSFPDSGWGVWTKPTNTNNKQWKWEGTSETLTNFTAWCNDASRRPYLRYLFQGTHEQDTIP